MRFGRLRIADVLMLPVASAVAVGAITGGWLGAGGAFADLAGSNGFGAFAAAWFALVVGAIGVLEFVQTVTRPAPTGGVASCVALCVLAPIGFWVAVANSGAAPLLVGMAAMFVLGVWGLRDESRGFKPDPAGSVTLLDLPERSAASVDG